MILTFDTRGNEKQKECARAWVDPDVTDITYGGAKGGAKSNTGCNLIFHDALVYPDTFYFIARKQLNDLRKSTIPSIYEVFGFWNIKVDDYMRYNGQDSFFQLHNKSRVYFLDAAYQPSDPLYQRWGSYQFTRGWIEEGGEFHEDAIRNLKATVGRKNNDKYGLAPKTLTTCNPNKNPIIYGDYRKMKEGKLEPYKRFITALPWDNKCLPPSYIENLERTLTPNQKKRLLYGEWEWDDDPTVMMEYGKIVELYTNEFIKPTGTKYMTCDIAYEGSDIFVIMVWDGLTVEKIIARDKISEVQVPNWIHENRLKYNVPLGNVVYDADGTKRYVKYSAQEGHLNGAKEFHAQAKPVDPAYHKLKSECYYKLAEYVNGNKIFIRDHEYRKQLIEELEQIRKMEHADDSKLRIEKKDDLKKRLGRSPDFADALMMRMSLELKPKFTPQFMAIK